MTPTNEPNRFDRYVSAVWARTATPTGLITVVVLAALIVGILWIFRVDVAGFFQGLTN